MTLFNILQIGRTDLDDEIYISFKPFKDSLYYLIIDEDYDLMFSWIYKKNSEWKRGIKFVEIGSKIKKIKW